TACRSTTSSPGCCRPCRCRRCRRGRRSAAGTRRRWGRPAGHERALRVDVVTRDKRKRERPRWAPPILQGDRMEAGLRLLELDVRRKLDGLLQGNHLGLVPGPGSEPGEARTYQPGDDVRRMDWAVTARTTVPQIRETIADRELETWVVV